MMKQTYWTGWLCAGALFVVSTAHGIGLGDKIPAAGVNMKNVDGRELTIAGVAGKNGTLVIFSCNHCPYVKAWETRIAKLGNEYQSRGIGVIQINANDPTAYPADGYKEMQERARERGFKFPYVVDATSEVARAFGAAKTPECYLFDKDGRLVYHGAVDDDKDEAKVTRPWLRAALDALLKGQDIIDKETKAVGCSIKFRPKQ